VIDAEGNAIPSQLIPLTETDRKLREKYVNLHAGVNLTAASTPKFFLVFVAAVPPLGYTSFVVRPSSSSSKSKSPRTTYKVHLHSSLDIFIYGKEEIY